MATFRSISNSSNNNNSNDNKVKKGCVFQSCNQFALLFMQLSAAVATEHQYTSTISSLKS